MSVYVLNHKGLPLMPCSPRTARLLLKHQKAKVVRRTPFTIQWTLPTRSFTQPVSLGIDAGYNNVGLSAVTAKKEVYAAHLVLRNDLVKLNSERRQYRRARRNRNTWYRKPRFLNRKTPFGWLAPSIRNKLDTHLKAIHQVKQMLPITSITVEVAAFDIQKVNNPDISGTDYQNGPQKDFSNVREYVLYRDSHTCQNCHGKSKDPRLQVHHLESRQTGGDRPSNLITLCETCHTKVSQKALTLKIKPSKHFKTETFMTTVRWKLIDMLRESGNTASHTYGYITKTTRVALALPKSHINDAFIIAGGTGQQKATDEYCIRQVRKSNRKLRKGDRSHISNTAPRFIKGFQRYDKVIWKDQECFIFGRRTTGYFDLRTLHGQKISPSAKHSDITLLESARTLLIERTTRGSSLRSKHKVSAA